MVYLPGPTGDDPIAVINLDDPEEAAETESLKNEIAADKQLEGIDPVGFPLYSIHGGKSDAAHEPIGNLPLVCFWAKRLKPRVFNRVTGEGWLLL